MLNLPSGPSFPQIFHIDLNWYDIVVVTRNVFRGSNKLGFNALVSFSIGHGDTLILICDPLSDNSPSSTARTSAVFLYHILLLYPLAFCWVLAPGRIRRSRALLVSYFLDFTRDSSHRVTPIWLSRCKLRRLALSNLSRTRRCCLVLKFAISTSLQKHVRQTCLAWSLLYINERT